MADVEVHPMIWHELSGTAAVTRASSGLLAHFARLLAGQGVHVTVTARRPEPMALLLNDIKKRCGATDSLKMDMSDAQHSVTRPLRRPSSLGDQLFSDLRQFMTGTEVVADGGHLVSSL